MEQNTVRDLILIYGKTINSDLITYSAQKQISCTVSANANAQYADSSYTKTGYTYIGTLVHSYSDAMVSILCGYAGASIGIRFTIHNFSTTQQVFDLKYRHVYIKG